MKKRICCVLMLVIIMLTSLNVYAYSTNERGILEFDEMLDIESIGYTMYDGSIYLPDDTMHRGVVYYLLDAGYSIEDADAKEHILNLGQVYADKDGNYSINLRIKGKSGTYKLAVYNKLTGFTEYEIEHVSYFFSELNHIIDSQDITSGLAFMQEYLGICGIDKIGYDMLTSAEKEEVVEMILDMEPFSNNDDVKEKLSEINILDTLFMNHDVDDVIKYIELRSETDEGIFTDAVTKKFIDFEAESKRNILADFMTKPFGEKQLDTFKMEVLREVTSDYTYSTQMEQIIIAKGNPWGFPQKALDNLKKSNKYKVFEDMFDNLDVANTLSDYCNMLQKAIDDNPLKEESSGGSSGKGKSPSRGGSVSIPTSPVVNVPDKPSTTIPDKPSTTVPDKPVISEVEYFTDLDSVGWAKTAINTLYAEGIVNGRKEKEFVPNELVLKEEFVKMLMESMRLTGAEAEANFSDVTEADWFYKYAAAAQRAGIVKGDNNHSFGKGTYLSRQDAAVLLYRGFVNKNIDLSPVRNITFADEESISKYALEAISVLANAQVINGRDNGFSPKDPLTRAEGAKLIYEFLVKIGEVEVDKQ